LTLRSLSASHLNGQQAAATMASFIQELLAAHTPLVHHSHLLALTAQQMVLLETIANVEILLTMTRQKLYIAGTVGKSIKVQTSP